MFKRYVLGYLDEYGFKPLSKSKFDIPLIDTAMLFNEQGAKYRFVVFDRKTKMFVYN